MRIDCCASHNRLPRSRRHTTTDRMAAHRKSDRLRDDLCAANPYLFLTLYAPRPEFQPNRTLRKFSFPKSAQHSIRLQVVCLSTRQGGMTCPISLAKHLYLVRILARQPRNRSCDLTWRQSVELETFTLCCCLDSNLSNTDMWSRGAVLRKNVCRNRR
jgi:hypothetical protein